MPEHFLGCLPVLILLILAAVLVWPVIRCAWQRYQLERRIRALGDQAMQHVMLDDGMGGQSYFEWLLLTGEGICLLNTRQHQGNIFAAERLENWAQVIGSRSHHFRNPLYELEPLTATLRYHLPSVPLQAAVLFSGDCVFPKGRPPAVLTRAELPQTAEPRNIPLALQQAWSQLTKKTRALDPHTEGHLQPHRETPAAWRLWLSIALGGLASGWLAWCLWAWL
ncbi:MAG: hypothetical protein ACNA75_07675 [Thiohalomonadaceae bacterium]